MILFDFSQIVISDAVDYHTQTKDQIDIKLLRHLALNKILNLKEKLQKYADEIVICVDGRDYWRKANFPQYKQNRKKQQKKDTFDWDGFHQAFNQLKAEFKENLPYKVVEVYTAEADDIMAVLATAYGPSRDVVIVSSDKDLLQIQSNTCARVKQYSPLHKKFIDPKSSGYDFFTHIIKGDDGDGVPNIFSDDDTFMVEGKRQKTVYAAKLDEWRKSGLGKPEAFCSSVEDLTRFNRNLNLIDLSRIPEDLQSSIMQAYEHCTCDKTKLFNYLVTNRLKKIMERGNF